MNQRKPMPKKKLKKYKVEVIRIGYGFADFVVEAKNESSAMKLAVDQVGSYDYSEKSSDYSIEHISEVE
jgi:hypothetical protein